MKKTRELKGKIRDKVSKERKNKSREEEGKRYTFMKHLQP